MKICVFVFLALSFFCGCTYYLGEPQTRFDLRFNPPNDWKIAENTKDSVRFVPAKWDTSLGLTPELKIELVTTDEELDTFMRKDKETNIARLRDYEIKRFGDLVVPEQEGITEYEYTDPQVDPRGARIRVHKHYFSGTEGIVVVTIRASLNFWEKNAALFEECIRALKFQQ